MDPVTGATTNGVERCWVDLKKKRYFSKLGKEVFPNKRILLMFEHGIFFEDILKKTWGSNAHRCSLLTHVDH